MQEIDSVINEMLRCTRCGFCQAACPIYDQLRTESAVARGKVQLLLALHDGILEPTDKVVRYMYRCLDCRLCQQTCPGGVRTDDIFQVARKWLARRERVPEPLQELGRRVAATHNIAGEDNSHRLLWRENLPQRAESAKQAEVVFFTGCVASLYPMVYGIPQSFVQLLDRAGVSYTMLDGAEWCCGYPLLEAGFEIDELIAHNVDAIQALGPRWLAVTCPSCYKTWKENYPKLSCDVLHSTQLLLRLLEEGRLVPAHPPAIRRTQAEGLIRVTYHDPCDLGRKAGIYEEPRRILARIPGIQLVEMAANRANAICCGGGGNLETFEPELSASIADRRLAAAQATGAEAIVTACQQCQRTLGMAARRNRLRMPVLDVAQILLATMDTP